MSRAGHADNWWSRPAWRLLAAVCAAVATGCSTGGRPSTRTAADARRELFQELRPVTLANCTMRRYGAPRDGGYLMCENLMDEARSAYSYGIDARDEWGCDIAQQLRSTVHEYDCFNLTRPACGGGSLSFHEECVGAAKETIDGRPYDSMAGQIERNGDAGRRHVVKIDVEGAEPDVLRGMTDLIRHGPENLEVLVELSPDWWADQSLTVAELVQPFLDAGFKIYEIKNSYWPWRYLWPRSVGRPTRRRAALPRRAHRLDFILSRRDAERL